MKRHYLSNQLLKLTCWTWPESISCMRLKRNFSLSLSPQTSPCTFAIALYFWLQPSKHFWQIVFHLFHFHRFLCHICVDRGFFFLQNLSEQSCLCVNKHYPINLGRKMTPHNAFNKASSMFILLYSVFEGLHRGYRHPNTNYPYGAVIMPIHFRFWSQLKYDYGV